MYVSGIIIDFLVVPYQGFIPNQYAFEVCRKDRINTEVFKLWRRGIVSIVPYSHDLYVSNIFSRPKPNGSLRLIIDLSPLNKDIVKLHFKMDDLNSAIDLLRQNWFMASIDLSDAFFTLPLHESAKKFVNFVWENTIYQYNVMPFGITTAPYIFTKVLKPIFSQFRLGGGVGFAYIDDCLVMAESEFECSRQVNILMGLLTKHGFYVNFEKSCLTPTKKIKFLGYMLDSQSMTVFPPEEKRTKCLAKVNKFLLGPVKYKIREVAALIGTLNDLCKGIEYGPTFLRRIEMNKIRSLVKNFGNFDKQMYLNPESVKDLLWWQENIPLGVKLIRSGIPDFELFTDASFEGWGAVCDLGKVGHRWSVDEFCENINVLELKAILFGLQTFYSSQNAVQFSVRSDNTTAVAYVNRRGGTKSKSCNDVARQIWQWLQNRNSWIMASHIAGISNVQADFESRHFTEDTEWELNSNIFNDIVHRWGCPTIDLFASKNNYKVPTYCSWFPDPKCTFVNAFSLVWKNFDLLYIFPPFRLVGRCIRRVQQENCSAIMVAPNWPGQTWFTLLDQLQDKVVIPKQIKNLIPNLKGQDTKLESTSLIVAYFKPK